MEEPNWRSGAIFTVFLAQSGGRILVPDAVAVIPGQAEDEVQLVDRDGRALAIFRRQDVSLYTNDGSKLAEISCIEIENAAD